MSSGNSRSIRTRPLVIAWAAAAAVLGIGGLVARALFPSAFLLYGDDTVSVVLPGEEVGMVAGFHVTNTILSAWLATLTVVALVVAARLLAHLGWRAPQLAIEDLLERLLRFVQGIVGTRSATPLFMVAATTFLFIAANAWIALLPVYGPISVETANGDRIPLLRGAGTDVNLPLALAVVAILAVQISGIATLGLDYIERFFRIRRLLRGQIVPGLVEFMAGIFELFIEATRLISLTFRLFGSLTAGEVLILVVSFVAPLAVVVPFYGLEILIGGVQAWIFASLLVVFSAAAMQSIGMKNRDD